MRRRALALFAGILVLSLMPGPVLAASVVDQSNEAHNLSVHGKEFAQTVTVGQTGKLTGVDLFLYAANGGSTTVSIRSLYRGSAYPTGPTLASATVEVLYEKWYHFEFATPVDFLAGGHFGIDFTVVDYGYSQEYYSSGNYSGGEALEHGSVWAPLQGNTNLDFAFRTYMAPVANPTAQPVPTPTPAPVVTAAPTKTPIPAETATPTATDLASPTASITTASTTASPSAQPNPASGDSGGPPIVLIIVGIVALAAVLGGGIGLGFVLARRPRQIS